MATDIYIRNIEDPNFRSDVIEISDELELFIQQIEMLLLTSAGDVLGEVNFGASLEAYIHTLNFNAQRLESIVSTSIAQQCSLSSYFNYTVKVEFYKGAIRDTALLEIVIDNQVGINIVVS